MTPKYKSTFSIDNPPLLLSWVSFDHQVPLTELQTAKFGELSRKLGHTLQAEPHDQPRFLFDRDPPVVLDKLDRWMTEKKDSLLALSEWEYYYIAGGDRKFDDTLNVVEAYLDMLVNSSTEDMYLRDLSLSYVDVFESKDSMTPLLQASIQGPPSNGEFHEHRCFYLSREIRDDVWLFVQASGTHGCSFRPNIRDGLEKSLSLDPGFKPVHETHCHKLCIEIRLEKPVIAKDVMPFLIEAKSEIDHQFLGMITEQARSQWHLHTHQ